MKGTSQWMEVRDQLPITNTNVVKRAYASTLSLMQGVVKMEVRVRLRCVATLVAAEKGTMWVCGV